MQNSIKMFLLICMFLCINNTIYAYRWIFNNFTSKTLLVQIELLSSTNPYFVLIEPQRSGDFDWPPGNTMAGFCLNNIKYVIADNYLLNQAALINKKTMEVIDSAKLLAWLDKMADPQTAKSVGLAKPYVRQTAQLALIKDKLFTQTVQEAGNLTGTSVGTAIVSYFANVVAESKCRSRDILIVEKNGKIEFYTLAN